MSDMQADNGVSKMEEDNQDSFKGSNGDAALNENESKEPPNKRLRSNKDLDIRFLISSKEAGAIIGKNGNNISHLRKTYKSSVTVPDCPGPERVLFIVTSLDKLDGILTDIMGYIEDPSKKDTDKEVELRLLIHTFHAGGIIGKAGTRIRELREQTKAAIKVFSHCCPLSTERVCAIQGSPAIVIEAIKAVLDIILSTQIKQEVKLYDPYNFDVLLVNEYGGFSDPAPTGAYRNVGRNFFAGPLGMSNKRVGLKLNEMWDRNSMQGPLSSPQGLPQQAKQWSRINQMPYNSSSFGADRRGMSSATASSQSYQRWLWTGNDHFRHSAQPHHHTNPSSSMMPLADGAPYWSDVIPGQDKLGHNSQMAHQIPQVWGPNSFNNKSNLVNLDYNMIVDDDGSSQASLSVPNSVAGAIIGKGGSRIRTVRRDSGADISIENETGTGKKRVITIKGTPPQVRLAYEMLQRSVIENSRC